MTTKRQDCHYDGVSVDKIEEKQSSSGFIFGVILGVIIGIFGMIVITTKEMKFYNDAHAIKTQCEAELPRNQTCKIIIKAEVDQ